MQTKQTSAKPSRVLAYLNPMTVHPTTIYYMGGTYGSIWRAFHAKRIANPKARRSCGKDSRWLRGIIRALLQQHPTLMADIKALGGVEWLEGCHLTFPQLPTYHSNLVQAYKELVEEINAQSNELPTHCPRPGYRPNPDG